jgi:hypothetical protein
MVFSQVCSSFVLRFQVLYFGALKLRVETPWGLWLTCVLKLYVEVPGSLL